MIPRLLMLLAASLGLACRPTVPPEPPEPTTLTPSVPPELGQARRQDDALRELDHRLTRLNQRLETAPRGWRDCVQRPRWPADLHELWIGLYESPGEALLGLVEGWSTPGQTDAIRARRLELIVLATTGTGADDPAARDILARIDTLRAKDRHAFGIALAQARGPISRDTLELVRDRRIPVATAVRFALADPACPILSLCVVGLNRGDPTAVAWLRSTKRPALHVLREERDLTRDEIEQFLKTAFDCRIYRRAELRRELACQLDECRTTPRGRGLKDAALMLLAELQGDETSLPADLSRMLHRPTRDGINRRLGAHRRFD